MNAFICVLITILMFVEWVAADREWLPRILTFLPDVLSIFAAVIVVAYLARREHFSVRFPHVIVLGAILVVIVAGFAINQVSAYVMIAGVRDYLKFVPFFFIPVVYRFTEKQLRIQLGLLLLYTLVQVPVAFHQRFVLYEGRWTGDLIGGTFGPNASGKLAIFLACVIAVLAAMWVKGRLSFWQTAALGAIVAIPCAMNETTVSIFTIPFAFLIPVLFGAPGRAKMRRLAVASVIVVVGGMGFVNSYDYFKELKGRRSLGEFVGSPENIAEYLYEGSGSEYDKVRRFDAVVFGLETLERDGNLIFGVGAGNAAPSPFEELRGEYHQKYWRMEPTRVYLSRLIWELGLVGVSLMLAWMMLIGVDALRVRSQSTLVGMLALSWLAVTPIVAGSFVYFQTFHINIYSYLFFFYSGVIAAEAYRLSKSPA